MERIACECNARENGAERRAKDDAIIEVGDRPEEPKEKFGEVAPTKRDQVPLFNVSATIRQTRMTNGTDECVRPS